jgi:hypothetical protein
MAEQEEITPEFLDSLERRLEEVRNQFEQYFLGTRKTAPLQDRTTVQYAIRKISNYTIPNTRLRFRFQQLVSKFNAYNQYWNRTMTQIEEGRYFRDRFKARLHTGAVDEPAPAEKPAEKEKAGTKPSPLKSKGPGDDHVDQVYQDFLSARKKLNQSTNISRDKIAETIQKQLPELQKRYPGKEVRFKVVVEGDKVKLKATVK